MKIVMARELGMCFGVKDAIEVTRQLPNPENVTVWGELVHNPQVTRELNTRGFRLIEETARGPLPETPAVLLTAHGVSDRERQRLLDGGREVIDTTCPLVRRAHRWALELHAQGYLVLIVGRRGHVEVNGLVGDLENYRVVPNPEAVECYSAPKLAVMCQTTTAPAEARAVVERIQLLNPGKEVRFVDTICKPTRVRQQAVVELLRQVDALVVIGGANSNNTRRLGLTAEAANVPWVQIQGPEQLSASWLERFDTVGVTAGTSTPDEVIEAVHQRLLELAAIRRVPVRVSA